MNNKGTYLLTVFSFQGYHGSMMHLCEIARQLSNDGWSVVIVSTDLGESERSYVQNLGNIRLYTVDELPEGCHFDRAICYHFPVLPLILLKNTSIDTILFGCLSHFVPLELPLPTVIEEGYFVHVHSDLLADKLNETIGLPKEKAVISLNSAPDEYYQCSKELSNDLRYVAVISNHVPSEIRELIPLLEKDGISIDVYGRFDTYVPITPEIIVKYDAIITIGKTVQYAMAAGIPVFEYDHFGGSGYVTELNVKTLEYFNFSGRSEWRQLSAYQIRNELLANYHDAVKDVPFLKHYSEKFRASKNIKGTFENADYFLPLSSTDKFYTFSKDQFYWMRANVKAKTDYYEGALIEYDRKINLLQFENSKLTDKLELQQHEKESNLNEILLLNTEINSLKNKLSEKEASFNDLSDRYLEISTAFFWKITSPIRMALDVIKSLFRHKVNLK